MLPGHDVVVNFAMPSARLTLATILRVYAKVSDEVIEATAMGRCWQLALDRMSAEGPPFAKGILVGFHGRLIERTVKVAARVKGSGARAEWTAPSALLGGTELCGGTELRGTLSGITEPGCAPSPSPSRDSAAGIQQRCLWRTPKGRIASWRRVRMRTPGT